MPLRINHHTDSNKIKNQIKLVYSVMYNTHYNNNILYNCDILLITFSNRSFNSKTIEMIQLKLGIFNSF